SMPPGFLRRASLEPTHFPGNETDASSCLARTHHGTFVDEIRVIRRRVDAAAGVLHHTDVDAAAQREDAELLPLREFLERIGRLPRQVEEGGAAVGVGSEAVEGAG